MSSARSSHLCPLVSTFGLLALLAGCAEESPGRPNRPLGSGDEMEGGSGGAKAGSGGSGGSGGTGGIKAADAGAKPMGGTGGEADAGSTSDVGGGTVASDGGATSSRDSGASEGGGPPAAPSFSELFATVFGVSQMASPSSCWGAPCHNPGKMDGVNLATKMSAYTTLRADVTPGNPATSRLIRALESTSSGKRMPLGRKALDPAVIARIKAWIMAGALND